MEFERYSKNYDAVLGDAVKITGYDASHFTTAKLKKLKTLLKNDNAFNKADVFVYPSRFDCFCQHNAATWQQTKWWERSRGDWIF